MDHATLQLIFNVLAITGVTSLTLIWYLRKRDERKLVEAFQPQLEGHASRTENIPAPALAALPVPATRPPVAEPVPAPTAALAPIPAPMQQRSEVPKIDSPKRPAKITLPSMQQDIRHYVTDRAQSWSAPTVSQWNRRFNFDNEPVLRPVLSVGDCQELPLPVPQPVILPRQQPKPAELSRLAAPVELRRSVFAAKNDFLGSRQLRVATQS